MTPTVKELAKIVKKMDKILAKRKVTARSHKKMHKLGKRYYDLLPVLGMEE